VAITAKIIKKDGEPTICILITLSPLMSMMVFISFDGTDPLEAVRIATDTLS
jgi:hypothetical protein